jgi:hypothetical protein
MQKEPAESEPKNMVIPPKSWALVYYEHLVNALFPCNFSVPQKKKIIQVEKMTLLEDSSELK